MTLLPRKALTLTSVALVVLGICLSKSESQTRTATIPKGLTGVWVLRSYYRTSNIWGISLKQARSLVGSKVVFGEGALSACKQHVVIQDVEQRDVLPAQFLEGNLVRFSEVGISGSTIHEITLNGNAGGNCFGTYALPGEDVFVKGPNELLVDFEGVYFRATRIAARDSR